MNRPDMRELVGALLEGDQARAGAETAALLAAGVPRERIVLEAVERAMASLDAKCTLEQFNLLEIMLVGRAVMGVMRQIYPPNKPRPSDKGTVVLATLEGDIHDLGKSIVKMVLQAGGYRVVDCGKDCRLSRLAATAAGQSPLAVGVSGLITSVFPLVRQVRAALAEAGVGPVKVVAGGAALRQVSAANLNVDFVAQNSFQFLHFLKTCSEAGHERT